MTASSTETLVTLRRMERGPAGASSDESTAWEIHANLRDDAEVDFAGNFVRPESCGKRAVVPLLLDAIFQGASESDLGKMDVMKNT